MKIKKGVILQKLGKEYVVYDNETSTMHEFNNVGFFILRQIKMGKARGEILSALVRLYDVQRSVASSDLSGFLKKLRKKDIVVTKK